MEAVLDERDYQLITDEVLKRIKERYDLVPKNQPNKLINLETFRRKYGHKKSPAWLKLYLLPFMPGVYGMNGGPGHPIRINEPEAAKWIKAYQDEIDWNRSLPR